MTGWEMYLAVSSTRSLTFSTLRTSQGRARAEPPASVISLATVLMVDAGELGFGGKSDAGIVEASEVVFAETTT